MKNTKIMRLLPAVAMAGLSVLFVACNGDKSKTSQSTDSATTAADTSGPGLTLPSGFSASVIARDLGGTRHIAISPQGGIYVKLNSAKNTKGGILYLTENNGAASVKSQFGNFDGTGIFLKNGYLYASSNEEVFRYKVNEKNEVINPDQPEKVVSGLISRNEHEAKAILLDDAGNLYVNIGAYSNSCQVKDREKGSQGQPGCPILDSAGGIWQFKADKLNQTYKDGIRYATGLRNVVGMAWNKELNKLFVMQHGRDQLHDLYPNLYTEKQSAVLPAECMFAINKGDNAGWPYVYYDQQQKKKIVMPEYGGDGKKEGDAKYLTPVAAFPGHLAPNGLLFYTGNQFPEKYKKGAFIAFHGSWNRAPEPQAGYFVVFQPMKDGKADGDMEVFADGFAGSAENTAKGSAKHRPCGLAQGPDGSLYVTDDTKGNIYKISYNK